MKLSNEEKSMIEYFMEYSKGDLPKEAIDEINQIINDNLFHRAKGSDK